MRLTDTGPRIRPTRDDWKRTPPSALGVSVLALLAAGVISMMWPSSVNEYAGFVWILALVPVFLLSYYRGWSGAAAAAAGAMVALTLFEVVVHRWLAFEANWLVVGGATVVLIPVTLGAGWLSDRLIGARAEERKLHERAPVAMIVHVGEELRYANRAALDLLGFGGPREAWGESLLELLHPDDRGGFRERLERLQGMGEFEEVGRERYRVARRDGRERTVEVDSLPVLYGNERALQTIVRDVTEQARMEEQLEQMALYDGITGLANRHLFEDRLEMALSRARRQGRRVAVLFLDVDGFKVINDSLGHAVGDRVLQQVARRLEGNVRAEDTVARFGGDEFTVLLEDQEDGGEDGEADGEDEPRGSRAREAARRLLESVGRRLHVVGHELELTASGGLAVWDPEEGGEPPAPDTVIRRADVAMLRAKRGGGGRLHVYDPDEDAEATRRLQRESRLREAVQGGEFGLRYQPIVRLDDGRVVGVEPLARWEGTEGEAEDEFGGGAVPPTEFIPLAEETGLIMELGERLLRQASRQMSAWTERLPGAGELRLHPNLSSRQLDAPEGVETLLAAVEEEGLDAGRVSFELTESEILQMPETVGELKGAGARVVMDDFGTGYSSLNYVRELPVDGLKLDMSFVHRLGRSETNDTIVELILRLGEVLDLPVTAEGIEREEQAEILREMGCAFGQGRHVAPPMTADELERWLAGRAGRDPAAAGERAREAERG